MDKNTIKNIMQSQGNSSSGMGDLDPLSLQSINRIIDFPIHIFPMRGCETFDIRSSFNLTPPTTSIVLVDWTVPTGAIGFWRAYSIFSDVPSGTTAKWTTKVNGIEVLKFHGDSTSNFEKNLALGNDLSGEIDALQELKGGDRVIITGLISAAVNATIAARIKGWIVTDPTIKLMRRGG